MFDAQRNLSQGIMPTEEIKGGIFLLVSGLLLITPGFFTDALGFLGLIPFSRIIFIKLVASYILSRYGKRSNQNENTIEGEFIDIDEEEK